MKGVQVLKNGEMIEIELLSKNSIDANVDQLLEKCKTKAMDLLRVAMRSHMRQN